MEPLTDAQRTLLLGDRIEVSAGCDVLNLDLTVNTAYGDQGDISDDFVGGSVAWNGDARIHRTCTLALSLELPWGTVLVRPKMTVSNGATEATFFGGVFLLTTPERVIGETPETYSAQGYDRLLLLDREVGADYTVTSGTTYRAALVAVFAAAGLTGYLIEGAAADYTLPATKTWSLVAKSTDPDQTDTAVTYLRIVNDLQTGWNGRAVWVDASGTFRLQAYQEPTVRAPEHTFNADDVDATIVGASRTVVADQFKTPNRWRFLWKNRPGGMQSVEGDGLYTYDLPGSDPMSATNRGLVWTKVYEYEAASQAVLTSLGNRRVAHDRRLVTTIKATTGPWPVAGHADVYTLVDAEIPTVSKVIARGWELDLLGGDTSWELEAVT